MIKDKDTVVVDTYEGKCSDERAPAWLSKNNLFRGEFVVEGNGVFYLLKKEN
jgi:hypothetical protein